MEYPYVAGVSRCELMTPLTQEQPLLLMRLIVRSGSFSVLDRGASTFKGDALKNRYLKCYRTYRGIKAGFDYVNECRAKALKLGAKLDALEDRAYLNDDQEGLNAIQDYKQSLKESLAGDDSLRAFLSMKNIKIISNLVDRDNAQNNVLIDLIRELSNTSDTQLTLSSGEQLTLSKSKLMGGHDSKPSLLNGIANLLQLKWTESHLRPEEKSYMQTLCQLLKQCALSEKIWREDRLEHFISGDLSSIRRQLSRRPGAVSALKDRPTAVLDTPDPSPWKKQLTHYQSQTPLQTSLYDAISSGSSVDVVEKRLVSILISHLRTATVKQASIVLTEAHSVSSVVALQTVFFQVSEVLSGKLGARMNPPSLQWIDLVFACARAPFANSDAFKPRFKKLLTAICVEKTEQESGADAAASMAVRLSPTAVRRIAQLLWSAKKPDRLASIELLRQLCAKPSSVKKAELYQGIITQWGQAHASWLDKGKVDALRADLNKGLELNVAAVARSLTNQPSMHGL